jgi:hypothetical protein
MLYRFPPHCTPLFLMASRIVEAVTSLNLPTVEGSRSSALVIDCLALIFNAPTRHLTFDGHAGWFV